MTDDLSAEAPTTWTAAFSVTLPARCVLPAFGGAAAPCSWRIEQSGDVVWCHTHGGVDRHAEVAVEPEFLRFVVEHLYDLIEGDLSGADGPGMDEALSTDDQIAYLRRVYDEWTRVYGRGGR